MRKFIIFCLVSFMLFGFACQDSQEEFEAQGFYSGGQTKWYRPVIKGDVSGIKGTMHFEITDPTADRWILGDTTAGDFYTPPQPMEITDVKVFWDPDNGDSCRVTAYDAAGGTGVAQTIVQTDTLLGTTWTQVDSNTVSSTYKVVTPAEGLALEFDFIAGTPNSVLVTIEYIWRTNDNYE